MGSKLLRIVGDAAPGLLFAAALALFTTRLSVPPEYIYDEVYHAYTAGQYVAGNPDAYVWYTKAPRPKVAYMWNHPPVGVWLIASGIALWGDHSYGWRFMSAVFGAAGIVVAYGLALLLTGRTSIALLTAFLLLCDGLYFVQSRTGMLDIFGTVFTMGALACFHRFWVAPPGRSRPPLLATGLLLGLAIATKWNAVYPAFFVGLAALWRWVRLARGGAAERGAAAGLLGWIALGLVALPLAIYLCAYVPFFLVGHDLGQFFELQRQIYSYHAHLTATHPYQSRWWQWPLSLRPVWYHLAHTGGRVANIYANGNLFLSLAFLPAFSWLAWRWGKTKHPGLIVLLIGFLGQWLPWALVPRIEFFYHFLPVVPWGCLAVAVALVTLADRGDEYRVVAAAYVILVVIGFAYFYPIYSAVPLTSHGLDARMWLRSWR